MCKISEMNLETAKYYGYEAQSNQLVEECAELIQAVNKYRRVETGLGQPVAEDKKAIARDNLVEEIADVELMLEQVKYLLQIPEEYKDAGGCFPEIVQVYLWCECKEYGVDYYTVLALIERESCYHWDKVGDNGNSKGYMQIYEKWHTERMEAEGVTDLFNPYQNIRVGLNCLREIQDKYLASSGENCVLMVYNMGESTAKKLWAKDIYSSAYSREVIARAQELRQELTQE